MSEEKELTPEQKLILQATSADEIKRDAIRLIEGPSGFRYVVRRVIPHRYISAVGGIPDLAPDLLERMPEAERAAHVQRVMMRRGKESAERMAAMLKEGLVAPKVGDGPGCISADDIPIKDIGVLLSTITELAGAGKAAKERLDPTSAGATS